MVFKADFDSPNDVVPVSDPEIFSELQRIAQIQTIASRAQLFPGLYDPHEVETEILQRMKVKDPERFLTPKPKPKPEHAANENIAAALGQPIVAFPDQDHLAHIQMHLDFLKDPMFGANPLMAPQAIPALLQNVKEHMLFYYGMQIFNQAQSALEKTDGGKGKDLAEFQAIKDPAVKGAFDQLLAAASQIVHPGMQKAFAQLPQIIQQAQTMLKQFQPPPMMDPSQVAAQGNQIKQQQVENQDKQATAKLAQQAAESQAQIQLDASTSSGEAQNAAMIAAKSDQTKLQVADSSNQTKLATTQADNTTAMEISAATIQAGHKSNLSDGQGVGGKPRAAE
jgi:hypothetical protein